MSTSTAVATLSDQELELAAEARSSLDGDTDVVVPILKLCQPLTEEVSEGDAKAGEFLNALNLENFGSEIRVVVIAYQKGRFYSKKGEKGAWGTVDDIAPAHWPEEYRGKAFAELDDAEERYAELINSSDGALQWGSGPPIQTTHNFVCLVEGSDIPVRLSLKSAANPAAKRLKTLLRFSQAFWDTVYKLSSFKDESSRGEPFFNLKVKQDGKSTPDQRQAAVDLALAVRSGRTTDIDGDQQVETKTKPKAAAGALDV